MNKVNLIFVFLMLSSFLGMSQATIFKDKSHDTKLQFIENNGQWADFIKYEANIGIGQIYMEKDRITFSLIDPVFIERNSRHNHGHPTSTDPNGAKQEYVNCHAYHINFLKASKSTKHSASQMYKSFNNYFIGQDQNKWKSNVKKYKEVNYTNIYDGIDFRMYGQGINIKYDFIVAAHKNPAHIQLEYEGVDDIYLKNQKLYVVTSVNTIIEQAPYAYQVIDGELVEVTCNYVLEDNIVRFEFPDGYDRSIELTIDPTLVFASYSGSISDNWGFSATFDSKRNLYGAGISFGSQYPITTGSFQTQYGGGKIDIAISKFSPDGTSLLYSTYLGGKSVEQPHSLMVNSIGQLIVFGSTSSSDFPVSNNAFDRTFNGGNNSATKGNVIFTNGSDIILTVFSSDGSKIIGSTFVGGSANDGVNFNAKNMNYGDDSRGEVFVDENDEIFVGSTTFSSDFPTTPGAYDRSWNGGKDACIFKMTKDLSSMSWGTFVGGSNDDAAFSLKVNSDNNVYACGFTKSVDFPTKAGCLHTSYQGSTADGFIIKLNSSGTSLLSSTYLGTSYRDRAYFLDFDTEGEVFVTGQSDYGNYPVTSGVYSNPNSSLFIHKLDKDLSTTYFSTVIGNGKGDREISPSAFMIDLCNRIYFSGWGGRSNLSSSSMEGMPITSDAFQSSTDGSDFYFGVLAENGVDLEFGSYFGGNFSREHVDGGTSRFDKRGTIYQAVCAGCGSKDDFPTTAGAYSNTNNSFNCNLGVIKFDFEQGIVTANAVPEPSYSGCIPATVDFSNYSQGATEYIWDFGDNTSSNDFEPSHTYTEVGEYTVKLIANGNTGACNTTDTVLLNITIMENHQNTSTDFVICVDESISLTSTFKSPTASYTWQNGWNQPSLETDIPGTYWVESTSGSCTSIDTFHIKLDDFAGVSTEEFVRCVGESINLTASVTSPTNIYEWNNGATSKSITITESGNYIVKSFGEKCFYKDVIDVTFLASSFESSSYSLCHGDSILWDKKYYGIDTSITHTYQSINGCDSTLSLDLIFNPIYQDTIPLFMCSNTSITLPNGTIVDSVGQYVNFFQTSFGCDSIIVNNLSLYAETSYLDILEDSIRLNLGNTVNVSVATDADLETIMWNPSEYLDCDNCTEVTVTPYQNIRYTVSALDDNGCVLIDYISFYVDKNRHVYIPNVFTPESRDGNNVFQVFTDEGAKAILYLQIYDRWGDLVYNGENLTPNEPGQGWDGIFRGELVDPAVFTFVTKVLFLDGVTKNYTGDVTVVR